MNTASNLIVEDCGVENSVKAIIQKYGIDERHITHIIDTDNGKQEIIEQAKRYENAASQWEITPSHYWRRERSEYYVQIRFNYENWIINTDEYTEEELNNTFAYYLGKYKIDKRYIPFIKRDYFLFYVKTYENACNENVIILNPKEEADNKCYRFLQKEEQKRHFIVSHIDKEQRRKQAEKENEQLKSQREKEAAKDREYKALTAKWQFLFDGLLIQRQEKSISFLLPNENNAKITAYGIIERLTGKAFKSYRQQEKFHNNKIQLLPYSERYRIVFDFRQQHRTPPPLENVKTVVDFINTARKYTNNWELEQQWIACLDATNTQEEAASLLAYYGWAADYDKEYPRIANVFYTVDVRSGRRHYNIINDDITLRLAAIENKGRGYEAYQVIADKALQYDDKENKLQALFMPLLWWNKGVKMGLNTETRLQCEARISEYIGAILSHNAFDNIHLEEHINNIEIDKSDTGITWTTPQEFTISLEDMVFTDYEYHITAKYNKDNADMLSEARSRKAAEKKFKDVTGDKWTTKELNDLGFDCNRITRLVKNKVIRRIKQGFYERVKK